ncbi:MAG: hypothetical protein PHV77_02025 [Candidatus Omnitrophica bacterium]|jgi:hypothetical protein|nr:hypothetical protein [Candidatus Omnitrophota bacterium]
MKDKKEKRRIILKKLQHDMEKDKAKPHRLSKWLKVMESKKMLFALEDEIDRLIKELESKK